MMIDPTARGAWDKLAAAAAAVEDDDEAAVTALGVVVLDLESAAGAPRRPVDDEPLVVLQRRFGHAQRRLHTSVLSVGQLQEHLMALCDAAGRAGPPVTAVVAPAAVRAVSAPCGLPC